MVDDKQKTVDEIRKENPMTLLDFTIIAGPMMLVLIIGLVAYFIRWGLGT